MACLTYKIIKLQLTELATLTTDCQLQVVMLMRLPSSTPPNTTIVSSNQQKCLHKMNCSLNQVRSMHLSYMIMFCDSQIMNYNTPHHFTTAYHCTQSLWCDKIDPSQNIDQSTSLESPYKELLNVLFSFEIRHSARLYTTNLG